MGTSLSIIIPTIGRPSLRALLDEIIPQLGLGDEVLVVGDGPQPGARAQTEGLDSRVKYYEHGPDHFWGHPQRNWAMKICKGTHIYSIDDDDCLEEKAIETIKVVTEQNPKGILIFRISYSSAPRGFIWLSRVIQQANVSTQMFVVPNEPGHLGSWGRRYEGDLDFITSTASLYPKEAIIWREEMLATHGQAGHAPIRKQKKSD